MATRYHFVTTFQLATRSEDVWKTLARSEDWVDWWRWLIEAEVLDQGEHTGVGHRVRHTVTSPLRYRLTYVGLVTRAIEPIMSRFEADGDLLGLGQFSLSENGRGATQITFHWLVETPKTWMNALAPLARPLFIWNHHRLMEDFAKDLAEAMSVTLLEVQNESVGTRDERFYQLPAIES